MTSTSVVELVWAYFPSLAGCEVHAKRDDEFVSTFAVAF